MAPDRVLGPRMAAEAGAARLPTHDRAARRLHPRRQAFRRSAIVAGAARLFVDDGFGRTTIEAIAEEAGVSRKTVFTAVGGKVAVLKLSLDWAVAGDDDPATLKQRLAAGGAQESTDFDAVLRDWVRVVSAIAARVNGLSAALFAAAASDDKARDLWQRTQAQRLAGARAFIGHLSPLSGCGRVCRSSTRPTSSGCTATRRCIAGSSSSAAGRARTSTNGYSAHSSTNCRATRRRPERQTPVGSGVGG